MADISWLECPECGDAVFKSDDGYYSDGDEQRCECGALLMVSADEEDVWVKVVEENNAP